MAKYKAANVPNIIKACEKCGKIKPARGYYKSQKSGTGFTKWCRECLEAHNSKPGSSRYKKCKKCGNNREKWNFFKSDKQEDGLSAWCKPCHNKRS